MCVGYVYIQYIYKVGALVHHMTLHSVNTITHFGLLLALIEFTYLLFSSASTSIAILDLAVQTEQFKETSFV